jgi:hypothetical protein
MANRSKLRIAVQIQVEVQCLGFSDGILGPSRGVLGQRVDGEIDVPSPAVLKSQPTQIIPLPQVSDTDDPLQGP